MIHSNSTLQNKTLALWVLISALLLISLVPGGPIETRGFSHIPTLVLALFNIFLTILGMGSLFLLPLILKNYRIAPALAALASVCYLLVYLLDLFAIFPKTPSPMPTLLFTIEVLGCLVAIPQFLAARKLCHAGKNVSDNKNNGLKKLSPVGLFMVVLIGNGIVVFATYSAMYSL